MLKSGDNIVTTKDMVATDGQDIYSGFAGEIFEFEGDLWAGFGLWESAVFIQITSENEENFDVEK